jgi:hypothetical protein
MLGLAKWMGELQALIILLSTSIALLSLLFKFVFMPHLKNFINDTMSPLKDNINSIKSLVDKELSPNGGSSVRDKVSKLTTDVAVLKAINKIRDEDDSLPEN